jgi:hypothetical protein
VAAPFDINGRHVSVDDRVVPRDAIGAAEPELPSTLQNHHRQILEVPRGADAAAIQALVNTAAMSNGSRPVVHLAFGDYAIDRTIVVPASDVQIVGDGSRSVLHWSGTGRGPVMAIDGPTRVTLRDFRVDGAKTADGVVVSNVDQKGSRIYLQGTQINSAVDTGLHIDGLSEASVDLVDIGHGYTPTVSMKVTGARATIYSGASAGSALSYEVSDGGDLMVSDAWYEGETAVGFARVRGQAQLTMRGLRVAVPADRPTPAIDIADLDGTVTLINDSLDDRVGITGHSERGQLLALGLTREYRTSSLVTNTGAARTVTLNGRQRVEKPSLFVSGTAPIPDTGNASPAFLRGMLKRTRASPMPSRLATVPDAATDLGLYRVLVDNGRRDVVITGKARENIHETQR